MKLVTILGIAAMSAVSFGQLWDQSNVVNVPGGGTGAIAGSDLSQLAGTENLLGWGAQGGTTNNSMADDFTVSGGGWHVTGLSFWAYQTTATAATLTGVNFAIDSDLTNTTLAAASNVNVTLTNIFRVSSASTTDANRRLQRIDVTGLDLDLADGNYWLKFNFEGSANFSGPWTPAIPSAQAVNGQNAQQSLSGAAYAPAFVDGATANGLGGDAVFQIQGEAVPEPATMGLLALGAAFVARRRKNNK
jgi:hypothetical protein